LRLQLKIGDEAEKQDEADQLKVSEGLEQMLRSGASESEIWASIEEFKEKYADYGRDRRSSIQFHLEKIERLLRPTTTTTVAMRAIENSSKDEEQAPSGGKGEGEVRRDKEREARHGKGRNNVFLKPTHLRLSLRFSPGIHTRLEPKDQDEIPLFPSFLLPGD
jgi:hypothetical protein